MLFILFIFYSLYNSLNFLFVKNFKLVDNFFKFNIDFFKKMENLSLSKRNSKTIVSGELTRRTRSSSIKYI
jgi:hypothetical protein